MVRRWAKKCYNSKNKTMSEIKTAIKEKTKGFVGIYRFTKAKLTLPEHFKLNDEITALRDEIIEMARPMVEAKQARKFGEYYRLAEEFEKAGGNEKVEQMRHLIRQLNRVCETEVVVHKNIVPTTARTMIANNLTDATPDNTMLINKAELGSGTSTPANGDTALQTPTYRNAVASLTNASNIAYITAFFSATETTGTYREAGLYSNGSAGTGTGVLVSRVSVNITKSSSETLTIDWELTIN